jgi:leucine dehydrogenase
MTAMDVKDLDNDTLSQFRDFDNHKRVVRFEDGATGLKAFISVHNTNLGPALGGCRVVKYETEDDAIKDVLRLSRGMTYKNALAGLPLGGGKSVIIANPMHEKTELMMESMGKAVDQLEGSYITAEDSGTTEADMEAISRNTPHVVGLPTKQVDSVGSEIGGNPSPHTAYGVYSGLKVAAEHVYGGSKLTGLKVAVQGVGAVGFGLCKMLHDEGVELFVTDIDKGNLKRAKDELRGVTILEPEKIFSVEANIFAPCALGGQLNDETIPQMKFDIIGGAANNQLATPEHEKMLSDKDMLYLPDYVLNSGGVIAACYEYLMRTGKNPFDHDLTRVNMLAHIQRIGNTLKKIFEIAEKDSLLIGQAADRLAEDIFLNNNDDDTTEEIASTG